MSWSRTYSLSFLLIVLALLLAFLLNISSGSVSIPFETVLRAIFGGNIALDSWNYILWNYRIPKAFTSILVGGGLSLSGLLMQTLFRNPLAGPFVLGISSGASLGAALLLMGTSLIAGFATIPLLNDISVVIAASLGSFLVLLVVMLVAHRIKDTMALLIIGLMFGSITAAIVSVLAYFTSAENLQRFVFWSFGTVGNLSTQQVLLLTAIVGLGTLLAVFFHQKIECLSIGRKLCPKSGDIP